MKGPCASGLRTARASVDAGLRPELRRASSHPAWLGREVARLSPTSRGVDVGGGALSPTAVDTRDPAPRRSITSVCERWPAEAGAGEERAHGLVRRPWSRWRVST